MLLKKVIAMNDEDYIMDEVEHRVGDEKTVEKVRDALTVTGVIDA